MSLNRLSGDNPKAAVAMEGETKAERDERLGLVPVFDAKSAAVTYGLYPQTHVSDSSTLSSLNELTTPESNGWYLLNGHYYAKVAAKPDQKYYSFDDGTKIVSSTEYWFECEPIEWKILASSEGSYSLVSSLLLDKHRFSREFYNAENGVYANNYANSEIRQWLNEDFLSLAFGLGEEYLQTVEVDNSAATTDSETNKYACENTNDKVYMLSYADYNNAAYFSSNKDRKCKTSDWARANGSSYDTANDNHGYGTYWTRSPWSSYSYDAWRVYSSGSVSTNGVSGYSLSVRPAITIKAQA